MMASALVGLISAIKGCWAALRSAVEGSAGALPLRVSQIQIGLHFLLNTQTLNGV